MARTRIWLVDALTGIPDDGAAAVADWGDALTVQRRITRLGDLAELHQSDPLPEVIVLRLTERDPHAFASLATVLQRAGHLPVIVVSMDHDILAQVVALGAHDAVAVDDRTAVVRAARHAVLRTAGQATAGSGHSNLDLSLDPLLILDPDRRPVRVNGAFTQGLGWTLADLTDVDLSLLVHPKDRAATQRVLDEPGSHDRIRRVQHRFLDARGDWVWLEWRIYDEEDTGLRYMAARDVSAAVLEHEALRRQARQDPLTGLANRVALEAHLDEVFARGHTLSVLFCDVDRFKQFNDVHGHLVGDAVLRATAGRLANLVRRTGDLVARFAGDEFVIVAERANATQAEALAERARQVMAEPLSVGGQRLQVTVSIGIAERDQTMRSAAALLDAADQAMLRLKQRSQQIVLDVDEVDALDELWA